MTRNIFITVFLKDGEHEQVTMPISFLAELSAGIKNNGYETIWLASDKRLEVTGVLIAGTEFHKEKRVILAGSGEE